MSYLVLARKYRPRSFDALVGQEHVVQALANALTQGRLHHAYLFTGTRGVGKTTVSRILAKSLNCTGADGQGGITASPCGVCSACRDIDAGRFVDYIELDAASNRTVEEITPLLDQAVYKPVVGRFKVYLIDEVHMLSNTAFNAMLKTLEEPPEYLKFVLATTDPQKVPATVLSRCLQFNLRPMGARTVQDHLAHVLAAEGIAAEAGALRLLARAARGSMRDALSVTDQAIAFGGGALVESTVRDMLGAVDRSHAIRLIEALADRNGRALLAEADALRALGLSAAGTLEEMADLLQQMAVAQAVPEALDTSEPDALAAARLSSRLAADEIQLIYSMALHGRGELSLAPDEHSGLVMVLLRMLAFCPPGGPATHEAAAPAAKPAAAAAVASRVARNDVPAPPIAHVAAPAEVARPQAVSVRAAERTPPPWVDAEFGDERPAEASTSDVVPAAPVADPVPSVPYRGTSAAAAISVVTTPLGDRWAGVVDAMARAGSIGAMVRELAHQSQCLSIDDAASPPVWVVQVDRETLRSAVQCDKLEAALKHHLGADIRLEVRGGAVVDTPALRNAAERERRQRQAEQIIHDDAAVRSLMDQYPGARIVPGSVTYQ
ncbi:MAG: DNA polymerase III, subunit gamma and tau [Burkholderiales bacterium 28-67-8]|nr:MAG: DNA polymerase III, subunit gamma and tau [Burkholderiales bacterium 28-67-8]